MLIVLTVLQVNESINQYNFLLKTEVLVIFIDSRLPFYVLKMNIKQTYKI